MISQHPLWPAVQERDSNADGLFVYGVTSTHIYCRPSCPSRRPKPERVEFFPAAAMAEARGFRPCRRCRPNDPSSGAPELARVRRACAAVAASPDARWTTGAVARAGGTSPVQIQRAFRRVLGLAPREYVAACRHRRFLGRLRDGRPVTDAIYEAGYGSPSRVYGAIRLPGMTPATYGRGGARATIHWAIGRSAMGQILVAATDRGVCFVEIGTTEAELRQGLAAEFPRATIDARPSPSLRRYVQAARGVADTGPVPRNLPVDIRGTAFQWRVWRALTNIRRGETRAYADIANAIGHPKAVRAVGRACALNPLSLLVPCHRAIGRDGSVTGYRWGTPAKTALLARERRRP